MTLMASNQAMAEKTTPPVAWPIKAPDPFVAATRINRYEKGVHEPDMATIARLAEALKVPPAYLLADDQRLARMILAFNALSASEKDELLQSIEPLIKRGSP